MNERADIPWNELQRLFSVVICFDESMRIIYASDTVHKYLPGVKDNPAMDEVFEVLRPGKLKTFSDALASLDALCLMTATNGRFAIRGQLLATTYDNQKAMCLCGAPWLFWMSSNCPDIRLSLGDFAAQDVQLDQLFFMTTEKRMVADLEKLNTQLTAARDELENAHDAQHRFFAQMSHEMRTPLNGVVSALSLLETNSLEGRQRQLLGLAQSSSRNLMDVINYVLDLSKLEFVGEEGETVFDLPELIRSTMDILGAKAREKSLELKLEMDPDIPLHCRGNAPRLRQTLLNLIMNAIKFTDKGSVTIRALKVDREAPGSILKFSVIDTGIGIASDIQKLIFDPFWSLQPQGVGHPDAGTGLGLDIVRRNVEHVGGEIGLISEPGAGSTFWFDWPTVAESVVSVASSTTSPSAIFDKDVKLSGRILLVDDNQTNLLLGTMIIESMGVEVSTAENGAEAVAAALQENYDLVLMDIHMPDFDGIEATRQIREFKDKQDLPIVALTALAYDKEMDACMASGMNGYLTKPIVKQALAEELGKWLVGDAQNSLPDAAEGNDEDRDKTLAFAEPLDQAVLEELRRQIGPDNLETVLRKVLSEATQRWEELISAESNGDDAAMQRLVHSLSSIFRSVGLMHAGDALAAIEVKLRAGGKLNVGWVEGLEKAKTDSLKALKEQLSAL
jgi:signal transduction histidine kinase/CheY-like chemotaxis protein